MRSPERISSDLVDVEAILAALSVASPDPDPFSAVSLQQQQFDRERHRLRQELDEATAPRLDVTLDGAQVRDHTVDAALFATFVSRLQGVVSAIGQSLEGPVTTRGSLGQALLGSSSLRVGPTFAGSFGVRLLGPERQAEPMLTGDLEDTLVERSVHELLSLVETARSAQEGDDGPIVQAVLPLGQRAVAQLRDLSEVLASTSTTARFKLHRPDEPDVEVEVRQALSRRLQQVLTRTSVEEEIVELRGLLGGASQLTNRFELRVDDKTYRGKVADDVVQSLIASFGRSCRAQVLVRRARPDTSAEPRESYTLVGVEPL